METRPNPVRVRIERKDTMAHVLLEICHISENDKTRFVQLKC